MHSRLRGARKTRLAGLVLTGALLAASACAPAELVYPVPETPVTEQAVFYRPETGVLADVIPYYEDGKYYLFYLHDYRDTAQYGTGVDWDLLVTEDFISYENKGTAIRRGSPSQQDNNVFTGSVIKAEGRYHIFYTGNNAAYVGTGKPKEAIMHAVSDDLVRWRKIPEDTFYAPPQYMSDDWRDPYVYYDEAEGVYKMLLAARVTQGAESSRGVTALLTSRDLSTWTAPAADMFDGRGFYSAKSAGDGEKRYLFGWIPTKTNDRDQGGWEWGGSLAVHELYQRPDGTLGVRAPAQREAAFTEEAASDTLTVRGTSGRTEEIGAMPHTYLLRCTLEGDFARAGFAVAHSAAAGYRYVVDTQNNTFSFENYPSADLFGDVTVPITPAQAYEIVLFVEGNVCTAYINGEKALSARTEGALGGAAGFYVQGGEASVGYTLLQPAA